jgi:pectate lyase
MFTARNPAIRWLAAIFFWLAYGVGVTATGAELSSFPGAQGYGKYSEGGRGGRVIEVTTLADTGPGSLRACMEAEGPRNCVFKIGGVIRLERSIKVESENGFLSVLGQTALLGQTAPGGGILITIDAVNKEKAHTPLVFKGTNDVILRHVRVRPRFPNSIKNVDAITVEDSVEVYVDHVSGSWATDENFNSHGSTTEITVAYSIFGEGLDKHSKCALLGSDPRGPQKITFWNNACISNNDRNPDDNHHGGSCIDIINNLFFNAKSEWGEIFSQYPGGTPISYVGNYFKAGPSTNEITYAINWNDTESIGGPQIYDRGNETWAPGQKSVVLVAPDTKQYIVANPPCPLSIEQIVSAKQAYDNVTTYAGAFPRDDVDLRFIREVGPIEKPGRGKIIRRPGELPATESGPAYQDADEDGMPDRIEARFGAKVGLADAWQDSDGNGWPNFDEVMQALSEEHISGVLQR